METTSALLEIRLFYVRPGMRAEFDRISREGTVPLMRRCGIDVVAYGALLNDDDGWYLIRRFGSEQQRVTDSAAMYSTDEWLDKYEDVVPPMISEYRTAVLPVTADIAGLLGAAPR